VGKFGEVLWRSPSAVVRVFSSNNFDPAIYMGHHETRGCSRRFFSKGKIEQLPFPSMILRINTGGRTALFMASLQCGIEGASLHICRHNINIVIRRWITEYNGIRIDSNFVAVYLVQLPYSDVSVSTNRMPPRRYSRNSGNQWPRNFGQRVEP
jgi:hypothetical protein